MRFLIYAAVALAIALSSLTALAQDGAPRVPFLPICEDVGYDAGVECVPEDSVSGWARTTLWSRAARQLPRCSIVVLDPDVSPNDPGNLGFQCDGVLTMGGLVPTEDDAP